MENITAPQKIQSAGTKISVKPLMKPWQGVKILSTFTWILAAKADSRPSADTPLFFEAQHIEFFELAVEQALATTMLQEGGQSYLI
jgi:hypothetical protein